MVKIIMHGCNGHMGQVISNIVEKDANAQIVAGIDIADRGKQLSGIYKHRRLPGGSRCCYRFFLPEAFNKLMDYCEKRNMPGEFFAPQV